MYCDERVAGEVDRRRAEIVRRGQHLDICVRVQDIAEAREDAVEAFIRGFADDVAEMIDMIEIVAGETDQRVRAAAAGQRVIARRSRIIRHRDALSLVKKVGVICR